MGTSSAAVRSSASVGVAVVTGASAGIGRATVRALAARGYDVALIARGVDGLEGAREEVVRAGRRALVLPLDVADAPAVEDAASRVEAELGPIDVWVNDAMASVFAPFHETTADEFERVTRVTYLGTVNGTRAALARMTTRNRGTIVQVGSALAYRSIPLQSGYCGAKAAIRGFTDSIRCELRHYKSDVHLTMVQMPAVNTPQFGWVRSRLPNRAQPVPPIFQPEVAARAIVWAATHRRRELYVGWPSVKAIVFGAKLFPSIGDWYLGKTGFRSQQTNTPRDPNAPDNLYEPVPGDHGAHGTFDRRARSSSLELLWSIHRPAVVTAVCGALALALILALAMFRS
jgi:short-subunit dehydrogenase